MKSATSVLINDSTSKEHDFTLTFFIICVQGIFFAYLHAKKSNFDDTYSSIVFHLYGEDKLILKTQNENP